MKKKILPVIAFIAVVVLIIAIIGISSLVKRYTPSKERMELSEYFNISSDDEIAIVLNREKIESKAKIINNETYLDYKFVHDYINPRFYWDENENILLYATSNGLISASADANSYLTNKSTTDYKCPVVKATSDSALIEIDFVLKYSDFTYELFEKPNRLVMNNEWGKIETASVKKDTQLRVKGGIKSDILEDLEKGSSINVIEAGDNWTKVMSPDGVIGYIKSKYVVDNETVKLKNPDYVEDKLPHIEKDFKICMAWHQVTTSSANSNIANVISSTKGVNVISPTWFYLNDNKGNIVDLASSNYVNYCHQQGIEVWALVSNLENPDVDSTYVLTHTSTRQYLVNQIIAAAIKYELDGINLDFEALDGNAVGDAYIQFVRELAIKCSNNGIVLSVDNYVPTSYTAFYNRKEQANFADYVVIMGYDEHYKGSDAGSVSSLKWVDQGVRDTLESVPENQVILGMPFYTRLWSLVANEADTESATEEDAITYETTSTVYGMTSAANLLKEKGIQPEWIAEDGQNYATWNEGNVTYKIWLENASSTEERLKLVSQYSLAGASFWKLGFESSDVWDTVIKYIN
ncbi:MAG: glycosyl hydrolase family 18 protein [Agathobacter sp.]|nr:glycosyl hydrolase family 18 protein [Agathobacter sp.]